MDPSEPPSQQPPPTDSASLTEHEGIAAMDTLADLLRQMLRVRLFEEAVAELRASGEIVGSVHLCNGQEAISVGACAALDLSRDLVFPTYRGHGWTLSCGAPMEAVFAELLGRESGLNGGRGGSAYHSAPDYGMYGENSIVGAGAPIACGAALAAQFDGSKRVAVAVFGEGAMNQGAVHEAMNFASVRHLPVVFVIENNGYSELTPTTAMVRVTQLYKRASAYGIQGLRVDGNDVVGVRDTMRHVVEAVRSGRGPALVEAVTQRLVGHYIGDMQQYRPRGEVESAAQDEPIVRARGQLLAAGWPKADVTTLEAEVRFEVQEARAGALRAEMASSATVGDHLYA